MKRPAGKPELLKEINRELAFDLLRSARSISRPQLATGTGLSRATIAILADELLAAGLIEKQGLGNSSGGRPPVILKFNPDAAWAIGACMHEYDWHLVLTNLDATVRHRVDLHTGGGSPASAIEVLQQGVQQLVRNVNGRRLLPAIGLGTPGLVDIHSGVIKLAADLGWADVPFAAMVEQRLGMKAYIANRSKVGALAELWYGAGKGLRDLIYISIGTGVSAGIIHEGKLYLGANSSAGELGHMTVLPDGPLCPCGNHGCLQQLVSEEAVARSARRRLRRHTDSTLRRLAGHHPEVITAQHVFTAAEQGDALALEVVAETASYLGIAVANLINLFNPELILLGGPVGQASQDLADAIQREVRLRALSYPLSAVRILRSSLGSEAGAVGASALVLQHAGQLFFQSAVRR